MSTEDFLLPVHWASYLINGDATGYTPAEADEISEWEIANAPGPCIGCDDTVEFCWRGDDGVIGADRAVFVFQVFTPVYSDGEVIAYQ